MSVTAGYPGDIYESANTSFSVAVNGVTSVDWSDEADELDTSYLGGGQNKTSIQGMKSSGCSLTCNYDPADTGQTALRARYADGAVVYIRFRADGTNGFYRPFRVFSASMSSATADLVTQTFDLRGQGAAVAVP